MKSNCALQMLLLVCMITKGLCIFTVTDPPSGSNIAGFENEGGIEVFCEVFESVNSNNETVIVQKITRWFLEDSVAGTVTGINVVPTDPQFPIIGDLDPDGGGLHFATNLTIANLTADLDRMLLHCGVPSNLRAASFTLRIYRPPSLLGFAEQTVTVVEGDSFTVDRLENEFVPEAFPFPQSVQWYKDGAAVENDTGRMVTLGYRGATFGQVNRDDRGVYTISATNYRLDDGNVEVGSDNASFSLTVIFGPDFDDDSETPSDAAVLQGDPVTMVCGKNLDGYPIPYIEWRGNNGTLVQTANATRYTFSNGPEVVSLTINNTKGNDAGHWSCSVSVTGPNGEVPKLPLERMVELVVVVPPSAPFNVTAAPEGIFPNFVHICWQIRQSDLGTPPLSYYQIFVKPSNMNFTTDGTDMDFNVTGLLPGTEYEFIVTAVSLYGNIQGESDPSSPCFATTAVTVPAPVCDSAPVSMRGIITVNWTYVHTGGLSITQVMIEYKDLSNEQFEGSKTVDEIDLNDNSVPLSGFEAGSTYKFEITAYNGFGNANVACPPVLHEIGIPRPPELLSITTPSPGVVVVLVSTRETGVGPESPFFAFDVNATFAGDGIAPVTYSFTFETYHNNDNENLRIDALEPGIYQFSVRSRNDFGSSIFTISDDFISVEGVLLFQLVLIGVQDCTQWVQEDMPEKLEDVSLSVQKNVEQLCTCGFATDDITDSVFQCSKIDADVVTFRATLQAFTLEYIEAWREEGPVINVQGLLLRVSVDGDCPVVINSFTDPLCEPTQTSSSNDNTAAIISGVVAGVVVVCVAFVIIIAVFIRYRNTHYGSKNISTKSALKISGGSTEEDVCKTGHILEATRVPEGVQTTHT